MEYLDIYDENENYLGKEERSIVHKNALWHKTVHCWLYDNKGNVYFQIRKKEGKLYTTASGHIIAGETVKQAFGREIKEEIGINIDYEKAIFIESYKYVLDLVKEDGSNFRDRAFSKIYICEYNGKDTDFIVNEEELLGIVKLSAQNTLDLLERKTDKIEGTLIKNNNFLQKNNYSLNDFRVSKGETAIQKYGSVLKKIIELTTSKNN